MDWLWLVQADRKLGGPSVSALKAQSFLQRPARTICGEKSLEIRRPSSPRRRAGEEARLTRAGRELQERLPRAWIDALHEPFADRSSPESSVGGDPTISIP